MLPLPEFLGAFDSLHAVIASFLGIALFINAAVVMTVGAILHAKAKNDTDLPERMMNENIRDAKGLLRVGVAVGGAAVVFAVLGVYVVAILAVAVAVILVRGGAAGLNNHSILKLSIISETTSV